MMKSKDNKQKKEGLNQSFNFFKGLEERYMSLKAEQSSKQSRVRQLSKSVRTNKNKKCTAKEQKSHTCKVILDISQLQAICQQSLTMQKYNFDAIINRSQKLAEIINSVMIIEKPKFLSLKIDPLSTQSGIETRTQIVAPYVQQIIKQFQKAIICIYSMSNASETRQFYDMLSIRRQVKTDSKLLVQTNICNNNKSSVILKKLIDVAKERQKIMNEEDLIKTFVIKIKGSLPADKQNSANGESRQVQIEICSGGYGQLEKKDLMGADKMRVSFNVIQCHSGVSLLQVQQKLGQFKKKLKEQNQNQLIQKIKILQLELLEKKKELESQKQRVAREEAMEAELQDIVLPSERPMVNIQKYDTRKVAASRKSSIRNGKCI